MSYPIGGPAQRQREQLAILPFFRGWSAQRGAGYTMARTFLPGLG
ncbi:MAG TPA: hypothetical protein VFN03_04165 [Trueperaceae bacterium]|nr:hypothetical protein [Trueperaceae bacterium]